MEEVDADTGNIFEKIDKWLDGLLALLPNIGVAIVVLIITFMVAYYLAKVIKKRAHHRDRESLGEVSSSLIKWAIILGGVILAMISRVSLGHTGRSLQAPKLMSLAFVAMILASVVRSFGPWGLPEKTLLFIDISGALWLLAFGLFVVLYGPMLLKARVDGRPG